MNSFQQARRAFETAFPTPASIYWLSDQAMYWERPKQGIDAGVVAEKHTAMLDAWCKVTDVKELEIFQLKRSITNAVLPAEPMCRDCADNAGTCPNRNDLPCDSFDRSMIILEQLKELKKHTSWHPAEFGCPDDDRMIWMATVDFGGETRYSSGRYEGNGSWWHKGTTSASWTPTHWSEIIKVEK